MIMTKRFFLSSFYFSDWCHFEDPCLSCKHSPMTSVWRCLFDINRVAFERKISSVNQKPSRHPGASFVGDRASGVTANWHPISNRDPAVSPRWPPVMTSGPPLSVTSPSAFASWPPVRSRGRSYRLWGTMQGLETHGLVEWAHARYEIIEGLSRSIPGLRRLVSVDLWHQWRIAAHSFKTT